MNKILMPKVIFAHRARRICTILSPIFIILFFASIMFANETHRYSLIEYLLQGLFLLLFPATIVCLCSFLVTLGLKRLTYTLHDHQITSNFTGPWRYSATIAYKDIKEVALKQGIWQRKFDVGTIDITSNATKEAAGFEIYNIENYQEVYDFLIKKITESNNKI